MSLESKPAVDSLSAGRILKGHAVCRGFARGRVKIIMHEEISYKKFKKGEVLVANFISPDHAAIVHKAKAVVADVGSIVSHSATIIREFRIPCIVNTIHATKILKDGDVVEIDAENGIIRIL